MIPVIAVLLAAAAGWLVADSAWSSRRLARLFRRSPRGRRLPVSRGGVARFAQRTIGRGHSERTARYAVIELCTAAAAELRSGRPPPDALRLAVEALPAAGRVVFAELVGTAASGGDVPAAMRRVAGHPGYGAMAWLAACWQVGAASGAGLAEAVDQLAGTLRDEERSRREVVAQLAAPRATARLLAFLPLLGVALAAGMGQQPLGFLFGTPYGLACLVVGVGLNALGLVWTARLAKAAEQR